MSKRRPIEGSVRSRLKAISWLIWAHCVQRIY